MNNIAHNENQLMKILITSSLFSSLLLLSGCNEKEAQTDTNKEQVTKAPLMQKSVLASGIDKANMDLSVRPQDNFYQYINGGWLKNTEIPGLQQRISD